MSTHQRMEIQQIDKYFKEASATLVFHRNETELCVTETQLLDAAAAAAAATNANAAGAAATQLATE